MRKRWLVAGGAVALCLGLAYPAVSASASGTAVGPSAGTASNPLRIDILTKATAINNFVDIGPAGPSTGDLYVFSEDVFFARDPVTKIGRADGRCTLIDPSTARFGCTIITSLPKGDITTEGTLINVPGSTSTGAVTGGTKDYRNARGEGVLLLGPPEGPHQVTFRLITSPLPVLMRGIQSRGSRWIPSSGIWPSVFQEALQVQASPSQAA